MLRDGRTFGEFFYCFVLKTRRRSFVENKQLLQLTFYFCFVLFYFSFSSSAFSLCSFVHHQQGIGCKGDGKSRAYIKVILRECGTRKESSYSVASLGKGGVKEGWRICLNLSMEDVFLVLLSLCYFVVDVVFERALTVRKCFGRKTHLVVFLISTLIFQNIKNNKNNNM